MKFFVFMLALGFTANLHAEEIVYNPGESKLDGAIEHTKSMTEAGMGFATSQPCCNPSELNQQRLGSTVSNVISQGETSGEKGEH